MNCLGIDFGTTSVKAVLFDEKLRELASYKEDYTPVTNDCVVELEAEKYSELLFRVIDNIRKEHTIDCLAIDTQCETLILTDENGVPTRNAIVWLDTRATEEADMINAHFGRKKVYEVTGQAEITSTWPASKLLWVRRNEPEIWAKTKKVFLLEDFLLYKLTGEFVAEKTLQSSTIYFDIKNSVWWKEMLDFIGVDEAKLPRLIDSGECIGTYDGIKVVTSAMDQVAGAIGAGVASLGTISVMTGTAMAIYAPTDSMPAFDEGSFVPCHYSYDGSFCLLAWSPTSAMALKWFRDAFLKEYSYAQLDEMAKEIPVGSAGLTFLPYLCGSIMPKYNPNARGSFTGITPEHQPAHFVRSIMESIACMLLDNLNHLGISVNEIRAMGGASFSSLWCQMKADMTGKTLHTLKNKETACLGSAILAGVGNGCFASVQEACKMIEMDKEYRPSDNDYSKVFESYMKYDDILNVRK
ncbi:MAG: hypothetical protein IJA08_07635 [Clostridia bacterium]|nr:hypothetical protein [Clostridia bacterium]